MDSTIKQRIDKFLKDHYMYLMLLLILSALRPVVEELMLYFEEVPQIEFGAAMPKALYDFQAASQTASGYTAVWDGSTYQPVRLDTIGSSALDDAAVITSQQHTSGTTLTVTADIVYVNPSTALSSLTVTLPASPDDQDEVEFHFGGTIAAGLPVVFVMNLPATVVGGSAWEGSISSDGFTLRYNSSNTKWYFK